MNFGIISTMNSTIILLALTAITTTDNNFWQKGQAEITGKPANAIVIEANEKAGPIFRAWGTTFNERDYAALMMISEKDRKEALDKAFGPKSELKFTRGRLTMNANDYSYDWYCCSPDGDFENKRFNIEEDKANSFVYAHWALERVPEMTFFLSPWSPPAWMKINQHYNGRVEEFDPNEMQFADGRGKPFPRRLAAKSHFIMEDKYLKSYADQFCKFITLSGKEGIKINRVMYQNEAYSYTPYPGCAWTSKDAVIFNRDYLAPALKKTHPEVKLWMGSINTNRKKSVEELMDELSPLMEGFGFQWEALDIAQEMCEKYQKPFICSEAECGNGRMDWGQGEHTFWLICKNLRYGAIEWYNWNYILEGMGTSRWKWNQNALINVDLKTKKIRYTPEYYAVRHYSQFIQPGAQRLGGFVAQDWTDGVIYRNPDGSIVVVAGNFHGQEERRITIHLPDNRYLNLVLPPKSFNTVVL